jgi:hypothetical protein
MWYSLPAGLRQIVVGRVVLLTRAAAGADKMAAFTTSIVNQLFLRVSFIIMLFHIKGGGDKGDGHRAWGY